MTSNRCWRASFTVGVAAIICSILPSALCAYETEYTHRILAENAVDLAWMGDPSYREVLYYKSTITEGDLREDDDPRYTHHFYDPRTDLGLPQNSYTALFSQYKKPNQAPPLSLHFPSALEWGRNGMPDHLDWEGAIKAYDYTADSRESAYKALGHVLHLVQDMAQPDHATDRPHPGNDPGLRDKLSGTPETTDLLNYVGYEALWAQNVWPRGSKVRKPGTIEDFFNELAAQSQAKEDELGLPLPDEIALGLGPMTNVLDPVVAIGGPIEKWLGDATYFRQNGWAHFEATVPVVPTIPWPHNQNFRTRAYLVLGQRLLPLAEEYSAGLLQFFHDIVAPPPFVMAVEIRQNGELKYRKEYKDLPGAGEKIAGRQLKSDVDTPLDAYEIAQVKVVFGPSEQRDRQTRMRDVHVTIEPAAPEGRNQCLAASAGGRDVEGSVSDAIWSGEFSPEKDAVLCIAGSDLDNHFNGRSQPGSILDSDPATAARATAKPPYEWSSYEPGPDRHHSFTVKLPSCATGQPDASTIEKMRWGKWNGQVTLLSEGKTFDVGFGGHGKSWDTAHSTTTVNVKFHSSIGDTVLGGPSKPAEVGFGNVKGSYTVSGKYNIRYSDGYEENHPVDGSRDPSLVGSIFFTKPDQNGQFPYDVAVSAKDDPADPKKHWWIGNLTGSICGDGSMRGHTEAEDGDRSSYFYDHRVVAWQFTLDDSEKPDQVARAEQLPNGDSVSLSVMNFWFAVAQEIAAAERAAFSHYPPPSYQAKYMACLNRKSCLHEADSSQWSADQKSIEKGWAEISALYRTASGDWIKDDDDFNRTLAGLGSAIQEWQATKTSIERKFADGVEQAAAEVRELSTDRAQALHQLAKKMRDVGLTAF